MEMVDSYYSNVRNAKKIGAVVDFAGKKCVLYIYAIDLSGALMSARALEVGSIVKIA
jgi:hypothetical protein